jgi:hypothetical protein
MFTKFLSSNPERNEFNHHLMCFCRTHIITFFPIYCQVLRIVFSLLILPLILWLRFRARCRGHTPFDSFWANVPRGRARTRARTHTRTHTHTHIYIYIYLLYFQPPISYTLYVKIITLENLSTLHSKPCNCNIEPLLDVLKPLIAPHLHRICTWIENLIISCILVTIYGSMFRHWVEIID